MVYAPYNVLYHDYIIVLFSVGENTLDKSLFKRPCCWNTLENRGGSFTASTVTRTAPAQTGGDRNLTAFCRTRNSGGLTLSCARPNPALPGSWSWWKSTYTACFPFGAFGLSASWTMPTKIRRKRGICSLTKRLPPWFGKFSPGLPKTVEKRPLPGA